MRIARGQRDSAQPPGFRATEYPHSAGVRGYLQHLPGVLDFRSLTLAILLAPLQGDYLRYLRKSRWGSVGIGLRR
jgi:hypothetical protein